MGSVERSSTAKHRLYRTEDLIYEGRGIAQKLNWRALSRFDQKVTVLNYSSTTIYQDSQAPIKNDSMLLIENEKRNNC